MVCDDRTLRDVANEFLALKKAQKIRDRTPKDRNRNPKPRTTFVSLQKK